MADRGEFFFALSERRLSASGASPAFQQDAQEDHGTQEPEVPPRTQVMEYGTTSNTITCLSDNTYRAR